MSEELKACPFCGNHVEMVNTKTYPNFERSPAYMKCRTCNYHIAAFDDENLINRWNDRPIEDALRAELEKRTAELHYANTACMEMKHGLDRLTAELAALREQVRWRKYPEEKPEEKGWYQTLEKNSLGLFEDTSYWMGHSWQVTEIDGEILFWIPPLPPPPEEQE